jgi:hypothetical protein
VRVVIERVHHLLEALVDHRVPGDVVDPFGVLLRVGQLSVEEEIRNLEIAAVLRELLDRVAAVAQDPLLAVDVGDPAGAAGGVQERGVVGHEPEVVGRGLDLAQVGRADRAVADRHLVRPPGPLIGDRQRIAGGVARRGRCFGGFRLGSGPHGRFSDPIISRTARRPGIRGED